MRPRSHSSQEIFGVIGGTGDCLAPSFSDDKCDSSDDEARSASPLENLENCEGAAAPEERIAWMPDAAPDQVSNPPSPREPTQRLNSPHSQSS